MPLQFASQSTTNLDEFGLYGGRVNALVMKQLFDFGRQHHVLMHVETADVCRGDDAVAGQLPHVELVDCTNTFQLQTCTNE